jgi:hypothetical protein
LNEAQDGSEERYELGHRDPESPFCHPERSEGSALVFLGEGRFLVASLLGMTDVRVNA